MYRVLAHLQRLKGDLRMQLVEYLNVRQFFKILNLQDDLVAGDTYTLKIRFGVFIALKLNSHL